MRRGSQRRVVCGLTTHGCKPVLRNALGLSLEHDSGTHRVSQHCQHLLSKTRMGLKHHAAPQFFGVLKGSREGARDGAPSAASFAA